MRRISSQSCEFDHRAVINVHQYRILWTHRFVRVPARVVSGFPVGLFVRLTFSSKEAASAIPAGPEGWLAH